MASGIITQPRPTSPVPERYRSRLMLTYRTNITGTPIPQRLPFRLLVLGRFTNALTRRLGVLPDLEHRPIHSMDRSRATGGVRIDDFMRVNMPWTTLPAHLTTTIGGSVTFDALTADVGTELGDQPADIRVHGTASFHSSAADNGTATLAMSGLRVAGIIKIRNDKTVGPSLSDTEVVLSVSGVGSADIIDDLTGAPPGKLIAFLDNVAVKIPVTAFAPVEPGEGTVPPKAGHYLVKMKSDAGAFAVDAKRALPLTSMASFSPDGIVANVPELRRIQVLRDSLLELQSTLRNNPELRKAMRVVLPEFDDAADTRRNKLTALERIQRWARSKPVQYLIKIPEPEPAPAATTPTPSPPVLLSEEDKKTLNVLMRAMDGDIAAVVKPDGAATTLITKVSASAGLVFLDRDPSISEAARLFNAFATLLANCATIDLTAINFGNPSDPKNPLQSFASLFVVKTDITAKIDETVRGHLDAILHSNELTADGSEFARLEANWRGLDEIAASVTSDDVSIDFLDVTSDELRADMSDNSADLFGSALFLKVYVDEYDRYGGRPFAGMIGLYGWGSGEEDVNFFKTLMRLCAAAHCPFISSVNASFFGQKTMSEVAALSDLDAIMNQARMGKWRALRDEEWAAYIGLTLPRYLVRLPWNANRSDENDLEKKYNRIGYVETITPETHDQDDGFLWGNASVLLARNVIRSYESSGWAQHIRGPQGGGMVEGLTAYTYRRPDGNTVLLNPVEIAIPDYREYQFARNGLIPLLQKKDESTATFFSAQSIKRGKDFLEDTNTKNAYLLTNLAYTFSITIIAHYVKAMMRECIGSTADGPYIEQVLSNWLSRFVTTVVNPDDLTLLYYPFKATSVSVEPKPGPFGWYKTVISVLPHVQFEGMDVELRLEAALGGKA